MARLGQLFFENAVALVCAVALVLKLVEFAAHALFALAERLALGLLAFELATRFALLAHIVHALALLFF